MRVLYIDDNQFNRRLVAAMLEALDVEIVASADARTGLAALDQTEWDLVLLDLHMPDMDGLAALRRIRARSDAKRFLPIIVITVDTSTEAEQRCRKAGADVVLHKPTSLSDICAAFGTALSRRAIFYAAGKREACDASACAAAMAHRGVHGPAEGQERASCLRRLVKQTVIPLLNEEERKAG